MDVRRPCKQLIVGFECLDGAVSDLSMDMFFEAGLGWAGCEGF